MLVVDAFWYAAAGALPEADGAVAAATAEALGADVCAAGTAEETELVIPAAGAAAAAWEVCGAAEERSATAGDW